MADDPNKTLTDAWFVSTEPHEYQYFKMTIKKSHPDKPDDEIAEAIQACRKSVAPSEGRAKLTQCVNKRLGE